MKPVIYATNQILSEYSFTYADLLKSSTHGQANLLKAIAKEGYVKEILSGNFINTYKLIAPSSVSSALKKLLKEELVYQTDAGYIIYDRFFNIWLKRQCF